jgi:hypothetical protein
MGNAAPKHEHQDAEIGGAGLSSSQTAEYTHDMLDSLRKIAKRHRQDLLARLLEAAAIEAKRLASESS